MARRFFDTENSLWHWIGKLPELCGLSLLWLLCSLPVITLVPASIALYDAAARNLRPDEKGVFRRFFRTFKNELGKGILIGLLWIVLAVLLYMGYNALTAQAEGSNSRAAYALIYQISLLLPMAVFCWLIPLQSRFVYPYWQLHKNAIIFTFSYLPRTGLILVILALGLLACWYVPVLLAVMPAILTTLLSIPIEPVFKQYMPEE